MNNDNEIPILDFSKSSGVTLEEGSEERRELSKKVIEAFEKHGCLLLKCDEMSSELREKFFSGMKALFDLPEETKQKYTSEKTYRGYLSKARAIPNAQSFGIDNDNKVDTAHEDLINLMWPEGNPSFSEALGTMTLNARNITSLVMKLVVEGFNLPEHYKLDVQELNKYNDVRLTKYQLFEENKESDVAFVSHTDKGSLSIICDNGVQGLQVLSENGDWVDVHIPTNAFVVMGGDLIKAWSNGRLESRTHRVVVRGDKERYTFVLFALADKELLVEAVPELVDETHPLRYRPFKQEEYIHYQYVTFEQEDTLGKFAGL